MTYIPGQPPTILLVDDNEGILAMLRYPLTSRHCKVLTASNGSDALVLIVNEKPDCIVLDVMMGGMSGYQVASAVRGDPATATIPIVMLSAGQRPEQMFAGEAFGADFYLRKPVRIPDFLETIRRALALSQQQREQHVNWLAEQAMQAYGKEYGGDWSNGNGVHHRPEGEQDAYDRKEHRRS